MARRRKTGKQVTLGRVLEEYLADKGALETSCEAMVPVVWPEVVGEWYARHTQVTRVWEGVIEVQCDSAARAQQLQLDSPEIIRRLNQRLGTPYVRDVRPSTGATLRRRWRRAAPVETKGYTSPAPTQAELDALVLKPEEEQWIAQQAAGIEQPEAREAFERTVRNHLKLRHWKLDHGWLECPQCGELYDPQTGCLNCRVK
ncbi:MAG: DUF721 domain-containing protein [Armatimonadetes bacterium]|nr:DUF721 domain-containing protein [Armatimonadota bacterium]